MSNISSENNSPNSNVSIGNSVSKSIVAQFIKVQQFMLGEREDLKQKYSNSIQEIDDLKRKLEVSNSNNIALNDAVELLTSEMEKIAKSNVVYKSQAKDYSSNSTNFNTESKTIQMFMDNLKKYKLVNFEYQKPNNGDMSINEISDETNQDQILFQNVERMTCEFIDQIVEREKTIELLVQHMKFMQLQYMCTFRKQLMGKKQKKSIEDNSVSLRPAELRSETDTQDSTFGSALFGVKNGRSFQRWNSFKELLSNLIKELPRNSVISTFSFDSLEWEADIIPFLSNRKMTKNSYQSNHYNDRVILEDFKEEEEEDKENDYLDLFSVQLNNLSQQYRKVERSISEWEDKCQERENKISELTKELYNWKNKVKTDRDTKEREMKTLKKELKNYRYRYAKLHDEYDKLSMDKSSTSILETSPSKDDTDIESQNNHEHELSTNEIEITPQLISPKKQDPIRSIQE